MARFLKCSDPTCNRHRRVEESVVMPGPETWSCEWHNPPNTSLSDHVRAVDWSRSVAASVDRS